MLKNPRWYLFALLLLGVSCLDDPECFGLRNNMLGITFKVMGTGAEHNQRFDYITTDGTDSLFRNNFNGRTFVIPINLFEKEMTFTFADYGNSGIDRVLRIGYDVETQFVSTECDPKFIVSGLRVLEHSFDSLRVINGSPGTDNRARNIEIFRCPNPGQTTVAFYQLYYPGRPSTELTLFVNRVRTDFTGNTSYSANREAKSVTLPVNMETPNLTYTFILEGDTMNLELGYLLKSETRYRPCGEQTFADSIHVVSHSFDSVRINANADGVPLNNVTDPPETNLIVYRCPTTNLAQLSFRAPNPAGTGTIVQPVSLDGITADYTNEIFYQNAENVATVQLPLNPDADQTTFVITYSDGLTETLSFHYLRTLKKIFPSACEQTVFSELSVDAVLGTATVTADSLTFPVATNVEVLNQ